VDLSIIQQQRANR